MRDRGRAAHPVALRQLVAPHAVLRGPVEIRVGVEAGLHGRLQPSLGKWMPRTPVTDRERSALAVQNGWAAFVILGLDEVGQDGFPAPTLATERLPFLVVGGVAYDVAPCVHGRGAA